MSSETGGFLIPKVIYIKRPGLLGMLARLLKLDYGWIEKHPADDIRKKIRKG